MLEGLVGAARTRRQRHRAEEDQRALLDCVPLRPNYLPSRAGRQCSQITNTFVKIYMCVCVMDLPLFRAVFKKKKSLESSARTRVSDTEAFLVKCTLLSSRAMVSHTVLLAETM